MKEIGEHVNYVDVENVAGMLAHLVVKWYLLEWTMVAHSKDVYVATISLNIIVINKVLNIYEI